MINNEGYTYVFPSNSEVFQTIKMAEKIGIMIGLNLPEPLQLKAVNAVVNKTYIYTSLNSKSTGSI